MGLRKISHYIKKTVQLGPKAAAAVVYTRLHNKFFDRYWRNKALQKKAHFSWHSIIKRHKNKYISFGQFLSDLQKRLNCPLDQLHLSVSNNEVINHADDYANNHFSILGSSKKQYSSIPWHCDIRLQEINMTSDVLFNPATYYKDVTIRAGKSALQKDIKVPWELSRLQHFFVLGYAYQLSHDEKYTEAFVKQYRDWLAHNSFLLGANWACPMDVGIRSINLIWPLFFFKKSKNLDQDFLKKITENLYAHFYYLEHNWELYDSRTSNHYLSDLIGYLYLCYYFYDLPGVAKRATWCFHELIAEFKKQIFDDGADYEGSTSYHRLITEIFYHFYLLAPAMGFVFEEQVKEKLSKMFSFIDWCTPYKGKNSIRIGDHDSGKILYYGLSENLINHMKYDETRGKKHFEQFGISLVKTDNVHYSLRHHVYTNRQPSGHFHNDVGSVTLAWNGIDIFVDPGSYLYTPSTEWRNRFRSVKAHNCFYLKNSEPVAFDDHLFSLQLPEHHFLEAWEDAKNVHMLKTTHELYKKLYGLTACRTINFEPEENLVTISDLWKTVRMQDSEFFSYWNFTVNPELIIEKNNNSYNFSYQKKHIATFTSSIHFTIIDGFISLEYGSKIPAKQLRGSVNIIHNDPVVSTIKLYGS